MYVHRRHSGSNTQDWPHRKEEVEHSMRQDWPIRNELAINDGIEMKGRKIIIPFQLQQQIP